MFQFFGSDVLLRIPVVTQKIHLIVVIIASLLEKRKMNYRMKGPTAVNQTVWPVSRAHTVTAVCQQAVEAVVSVVFKVLVQTMMSSRSPEIEVYVFLFPLYC